MRTLSMDEYYDAITYGKRTNMDNLTLAIYHWVSDFSDRRVLRQAWDMVSVEDQNTLLNQVYRMTPKEQVLDEDDIEIITGYLCRFGSMSNEYHQIDDDILDEIQSEWLGIFNKNYLDTV